MPDISFDRRVSDELMAALGPDGFAHSLVEYAHSGQYGLDLGLRSGRPKSTRSWATLYAGTTRRLTWSTNRARASSSRSTTAGRTRSPTPPAHGTTTGRPTAAVTTWPGNGPRSRPSSRPASLLAQQRQPLADALQQAVSPDIPWLTPDLSSTECDALAITPDGNLLAIEIKPGAVGSAAAKSPLQAWQYARQIQAWVDQPNPLPGSDPVTVLRGMYAQRRQLGLLHGGSPEDPPLADHPRVIPAIAIRPRHSPEVKNRLRLVAELLASDPALSAPPMQYYLVNLVGRLDTFDPFEPGSW